MKQEHKTPDPIQRRLDEIVVEIGRLYAEADALIDHLSAPVWLAGEDKVLN